MVDYPRTIFSHLTLHSLKSQPQTSEDTSMRQFYEQSNAALPLLSVARSLVSTPEPDTHIIQNLSDTLNTVSRDVTDTYAACKRRSGPTPRELSDFPIESVIERLEAVADALMIMEYPSELTSWIDKCRNLGDNLVSGAEQCFAIIQRMDRLRCTSETYHDYIQRLVRSLKVLQDDTIRLYALFTDYLDNHHSPNKQHVVTFDVWKAGRLSGLREAADLVQEAIDAHNDQPHSATLETMTQLLHTLQMRADLVLS
jgi:hypothetical protein